MIKAIIFDFDDTLYTGKVWGNYFNYEKNLLLKVLKDEKKYDELVQKYSIDKSKSPMETVSACRKEGYDFKQIMQSYKDNIYQHTPSEIVAVPNELLTDLSKKCILCVVSMSSQNYLKYYFPRYNFDWNLFTEIISVDCPDELDKGLRYQEIMQTQRLNPSDILVVGDNFNIDILPAQTLGMKTLYFQGDYNAMYNCFTQNGILDCTPYLNKVRNIPPKK